MRVLIAIIICIAGVACNTSIPKQLKNLQQQQTKVVYVQPYMDITAADVHTIVLQLQQVFDSICVLPAKPIPASAYTKPRNRYRADSLLRIINNTTPSNCKTIALTNYDISTTKQHHADYGIMGLGYTPGKACVVSTFRLNKKYRLQQLYKVAIHELGHTFGLPHCANTTCYMADAKGANPLQQEVAFCSNCITYLNKCGWKL